MYITMALAPPIAPITAEGELPRYARAYNLLIASAPKRFYKREACDLIAKTLGCTQRQATGAYEHLLTIGLIIRSEFVALYK